MSTSPAESSSTAARREDPAARALSSARGKALDAFLVQTGAASLSNLVTSEAEAGDEEGGSWVWLLNLGEQGGGLDAKRTRVDRLLNEALGAGRTQDIIWIPPLGKTFSLLRLGSASLASQFLAAYSSLPPSSFYPSSSRSAKPIVAIAARASSVRSQLPPTPTSHAASEFAPGKRRWPCGVEVWEDFVTEEQEAMLISAMRAEGEWSDGAEKRLSVHFGPHFDYTTNATKAAVRPLPSYMAAILASLPYAEHPDIPDQMTGQLYPPATGIPPHVDTHSPFGPVIWGISLGSTVVMELKRCGPTEARRMREPKRSLAGSAPSPSASPSPSPTPPSSSSPHISPDSDKIVLVDLPPRSLLVLAGPARYRYTHAIRPRRLDPTGRFGEVLRPREDRYSLTFRACKSEEERRQGCQCEWPDWCDSRF